MFSRGFNLLRTFTAPSPLNSAAPRANIKSGIQIKHKAFDCGLQTTVEGFVRSVENSEFCGCDIIRSENLNMSK